MVLGQYDWCAPINRHNRHIHKKQLRSEWKPGPVPRALPQIIWHAPSFTHCAGSCPKLSKARPSQPCFLSLPYLSSARIAQRTRPHRGPGPPHASSQAALCGEAVTSSASSSIICGCQG